MVKIKNKLRQPLSLNLKDKTSVHLSAKGEAEVSLENFDSSEIKQNLEAGNIIVIKMD